MASFNRFVPVIELMASFATLFQLKRVHSDGENSTGLGAERQNQSYDVNTCSFCMQERQDEVLRGAVFVRRRLRRVEESRFRELYKCASW